MGGFKKINNEQISYTNRNNFISIIATCSCTGAIIARRIIFKFRPIILYFLALATICLLVLWYEINHAKSTYLRPKPAFINNIHTSAAYARHTILKKDQQSQATVTQNLQETEFGEFQVIGNGGGYGYTAFMDDRPARDVPPGSDRVIRVLAYILSNVNPELNWKCILHMPGQPVLGLVTSIHAVNEFFRFPQLKKFRIVMLVCSMPPNVPSHTYQAPSHISVVTADEILQNSQVTSCGEYDHHSLEVKPNSKWMDWICLWNASLNTIQVTDLMKQRDESKKSSAAAIKFTICVSPMYGLNYEWKDILKFIEINKVLGANKFIFYVDSSVRKSVAQFLEKYSTDIKRQDLVEVYGFNLHLSGMLHLTRFGQTISLNDCLYRTMYHTRYMVSQDLDELIVPLRNKTWSDLVQHLNKTYSQTNFGVASFRNVWLPLKYPNDPVYGSNSAAVLYDITQLLKYTRDSFIDPPYSRAKVMLRPEAVLLCNIHYVHRQDIVNVTTNPQIYVSEQDALLYHYRKVDPFGNTTISSLRLREYADVIQARVQSEMKHFIEHEQVPNED